MKQVIALLIGMSAVSLSHSDAVAGIDGYCYYVTAQGNMPACSVTIYCKRFHDGQVFEGNS